MVSEYVKPTLFLVVVALLISTTEALASTWGCARQIVEGECGIQGLTLLWATNTLIWLFVLSAALLFYCSADMTSQSGSRLYKCLYFIGCCGLVVLVSAYLFGWAFFFSVGRFPAPDVIEFGLVNCRMLMLYFWQSERGTLFGAVGAYVAALGAIAFGVRRLRHMTRRFLQARLFLLTTIAAVLLANLCVLCKSHETASARNSSSRRIQAYLQQSPPFSFEWQHRISPLSTFLAHFLSDSEATNEYAIPKERLPVLASVPTDTDKSLPSVVSKERIVILVTIESLRCDAVMQLRDGIVVMPCVRRLAEEGLLFPRCYVQSTHSDYSDPSIYSSLYPLRTANHHYYQRHDPWPKTLVFDCFRDAGYATGFFSSQNEAWGQMDAFYGTDFVDTFFDSRAYDGATRKNEGSYQNWAQVLKLAGKLDDSVTIDRAIDWLRTKDSGSLFLALNLQTPHFPYTLPVGSGPFQPDSSGTDASLLYYPEKDKERFRNSYCNALNYADGQLSRLVDEVRSEAVERDVVVAVTGDHGEAFWDSGITGHAGSPAEAVCRSAVVLWSPTIVNPGVVDAAIESIDVVPTILGISGIEVPDTMQGVNVLSGKGRPQNKLFYTHCCNAVVCSDAVVAPNGWKYVFDNWRQSEELFRVGECCSEVSVEIGDYMQVCQILRNNLREWRSQQLSYYQNAKYYSWFGAPKPPCLSPEEMAVLNGAVNATHERRL